ncbi:hypothetical protein, partial [Klebsiella michiganensis]|uniref:hypothetical protein n=1 Tax=Klebsiella michiganensis TaxID=1134687 RepID=UPI001CCD3B85
YLALYLRKNSPATASKNGEIEAFRKYCGIRMMRENPKYILSAFALTQKYKYNLWPVSSKVQMRTSITTDNYEIIS